MHYWKRAPTKRSGKGPKFNFCYFFLPGSWHFAFYDFGLVMYSSHIVHIKTKIRQKTNFSTIERRTSVVPFQTHSLILHSRTSSFVEIFNCFFQAFRKWTSLLWWNHFALQPFIIHLPQCWPCIEWQKISSYDHQSVVDFNVNTLLDNIYYVDNVDRLLTHLDTLLTHF